MYPFISTCITLQCLEPFISCLANPLTDAIAKEGLRHGARSLLQAVENGSDLAAREGMSLCSLFGGLALANAKLGAVHGFAGKRAGIPCRTWYSHVHSCTGSIIVCPVLQINLY